MTKKQKWLYSLLVSGIVTTLVLIFIYVMAFNPNISDAWDAATGGTFLFRNDVKNVTECYLPFVLLYSMPMMTILFRITIFNMVDNIEKSLEVEEDA